MAQLNNTAFPEHPEEEEEDTPANRNNKITGIMKTSLCNEDPLTPHFYIVKLGFIWLYIIFLFLL